MDTGFSQLRYVQTELARVGYSGWKDVSRATKIPFGTVRRIGYKTTENPRAQAIDKIAAYFRTKEKRGA